MAIKYIGANTLYLAGSGSTIIATSITLTSFSDIYGNVLTMTDFGDIGYITLEPDTVNQEFATFTGVIVNANLTYTLTGVKTSLAKSPYTQIPGLVRQHSGGTKVVISDTPAFWNTFSSKENPNTFTDIQTFVVPPISSVNPTNANQVANKLYVDSVAVAGAPNASITVKGIVELATQAEVDARTTTGGTGAALVVTPDTQRSTLLSDGVDEIGVVATITAVITFIATPTAHGLVANDTVQFTTTGALPTGLTINTTYFVIAAGLTANTFQLSATSGGAVINTTGTQSGIHSLFRSNQYVFNTPVATTALGAFKEFSFRAKNTNTTTSPTIIINGLASKGIRKLNGATNLVVGDIAAGQIIKVTDDGTNFQMLSPVANAPLTFVNSTYLLVASSNVILSSPTLSPIGTTFASSNYAKVKEIQVYFSGTINTDYTIKAAQPGSQTTTRIYINNISRGNTVAVAAANVDQVVSETFRISAGDFVQIFTDVGSQFDNNYSIKNFNIKADKINDNTNGITIT